MHRTQPPSARATRRPIHRAHLRLVSRNGHTLDQMSTDAEHGGRPGNGENRRPLTARGAYEKLIADVTDVRERLDPASEARRDLGFLLAELERTAARQQG